MVINTESEAMRVLKRTVLASHPHARPFGPSLLSQPTPMRVMRDHASTCQNALQ